MKGLQLTIACFTLVGLFFTNDLNAQCFKDTKGNWVNPDGSDCTNTILTAVPFLRIVSDARSGAMGDVGIGLSPDANAMHFNQSKLVMAESPLGISATYTPWLRSLGLNDVYLAYLTGYYKLDDNQAIGAGLRYFSLGNINFTDENGNAIGTGNPNEFEATVAYSRRLSDKFTAAVGAKFIYSNLASGQQVDGQVIEAGKAGAADFSFTYNTDLETNGRKSDLTIGLAVSNIGSKITYTNAANGQKDFLPTNLGIGGAWSINLDSYNSLTIATDFNKLLVPTRCFDCDADGDGIADWRQESPISGIFSSFSDAPNGFDEELKEINYSVGLEYWYDKQFAVRAGYFSESRTKGDRHFFTVGLGLKYNIFGLNFSYLVPTTNQRNPLDNTLRFSLLFDFGAFGAAEGVN
ncbi:MAG: type IX secretion system outer membrane channel protein PorV [Saprospiraceae bacterium]|nr:type IX secretion system outer membrane channel protein PorV [Saprospiraceae bacterium]MCF8249057.1 type IX secretion system outer membrane channel protein PorV [Saprospiraceae bacterium]MCF8282728.1 type IX secretion system outer membrane channel protein PorV [Bacteroidales bacterium]MCF8311079.1 type IX secretion system outer membrane channel protein PorV [Saprospiraceae bacterium]MCF8443076.1 type IX secretion system outer membrane channel protein PorV [Saprospiraceae bacterium]